MNDYLLIYLWTRLDSITILLTIGVVISLIGAFVIGVATGPDWSDGNPASIEWYSRFKLCLYTTILAAFVNCMIPTQKDAAIIYIAPKLINNKKIQEAFNTVPSIALEGLTQIELLLKELNNKNVKENKK